MGVPRRQPVEWLRRHPTATAMALFAAVALLFVGKGLLPGRALSASDYLWSIPPWEPATPSVAPELGSNEEQVDAVLQFQVFLQYTRAHLPDVPLWNPHVMGGRAFLADQQSAIFSPFSLPSYVLSFWTSLAVAAWMKLMAAASGAYLLGRSLGMRFRGGVACGLTFGFCLFTVAWIPWPVASVFVLLPWLLLLADVVARRPRPLVAVALAGLVAAVCFGGQPQAAVPSLLLTAAFFAFRLAGRRPSRREVVRPVVAFGLGVTAGAAVAALTLVPFAEVLFRSYDYGWRSQVGVGSLDPKFLLGILLPDFWGRAPFTHAAARASRTGAGGLEALMVDRAFYVGALALMLAAIGLVLRPSRARLAVAALAASTMALITGWMPLVELWSHVPVIDTIHTNKLVAFVVLALALLAGWSADALGAEQLSTRRGSAAIAVAVALLALPVLVMVIGGTLDLSRLSYALELAWGSAKAQTDVPRPPDVADVRLAALLEWLVPAALGALLIVLAVRGRLAATTVTAAMAVLIVADLWRVGGNLNPVIGRSAAVQPVTPAIKYLRSRRPSRFAGLASGLQSTLPANLAMRYGLYDARGYDFPVDRRVGTYWNRAVNPLLPDTALLLPASPSDRALRGLGLLSVADLVQDPAAPPLTMPGLRIAYDGPDARVYANARALPRAFLVDRQRSVESSKAALAAVVAPTFDARAVAVTESPAPGIGRSVRSARRPGSARIVRDGGDVVAVVATARRRSLLVLTDAYDPGWAARVDGRPAAVLRVDYLLRGVVVGPGRHRVELRYEPAAWRWGRLVSLLALLSLCVAATSPRWWPALRGSGARPSRRSSPLPDR